MCYMQEEGKERKAGVSETGPLAGFMKLGLNPEGHAVETSGC